MLGETPSKILEPAGLSQEPDAGGEEGERARHLNVRFDGLASPIRCAGLIGDGSIELSAALGFLRVGSRVEVEAAGAEGGAAMTGKIDQVLLRVEDGVPRFEISLAVERPEAEPIAAAVPAELDYEWSFPEIIVELPPATPEPAGDDRTERVAPASRGRRWALVAIGSLLAGGAMVALVGRGHLPFSSPAVTAPPAPAPVLVVSPVAPPIADPPPAAEAPRIVPEHPVVAEDDPPPAAAAAPSWKPELQVAGGRARVSVPVGGSTAGLSTFRLTDPPGIAIDLPEAQAAVPLRSYLLHKGAFRSLWVRENPKGGLQIRAHLAARTAAEVKVEGGALVISVPATP